LDNFIFGISSAVNAAIDMQLILIVLTIYYVVNFSINFTSAVPTLLTKIPMFISPNSSTIF
jgi:hypothetical protein